jgi:hypothetical protein
MLADRHSDAAALQRLERVALSHGAPRAPRDSERVNESPDSIVMMSHERADDGTEG